MCKSTRLITVAAILFTVSWQGELKPVDAQEPMNPVRVVESSAARLVLQVSLPDMYVEPVQMADGNTYTAVRVPNSGVFEEGKPAVPLFGNWILIPNGTEAELEINPGDPVQIPGDFILPPVQPPWADLEGAREPPFTKDEDVYQTDADCPGVLARLEPTMIMRGQECTIIWLYPYQHNPVRRTLKVYPDLTVTVWFHGEPSPIPSRLKSESFEVMMRQMAINAEAVLAAEKEVEFPPIPGPYGWDYLILTHPNFATAANKLAAWKNKIGFKTLVTQLPQKWQVSDIKNALQGAYNNWDIVPQYILLIGDAEYIPTHYETLHPYENMIGGKGTQGYIGTDLYYTTLQGSDYLPDIFIGRLSVDSSEYAGYIVDRIIKYEEDPPTDSSFYNNVAICAYFQDGISGIVNPDEIEDSRFTQTSEDLAIFLSNHGKTVNRIYYADPGVTPTKWNNNQIMALNNFGGGPAGNPGDPIPSYLKKPGFAWDGDNNDITAAFQAGSFLVTHRDHGGRMNWSHPYYHWSHVIVLPIPYPKLPVIWSVNCQTGWFDNETDFKKPKAMTDLTKDSEESLSEFFQRYTVNGGPVGIIAATRVTDSVYNDRLFWGWTDAIWPDFMWYGVPNLRILRMGDVLNYGKIYMSTTVPDNIWRKTHFEAYHWFGDPTMQIRTQKPLLMVAKFPELWPWALVAKDFTVHVDFEPYPGPFEKATVTISKADSPSDYWVGRTDEEGNVTFPGLVTSSLGEYDVVVTASNGVPFAGTFQSQAGPTGGILLDAEVYSCSSEIEIKVADADLRRAGTVDVSVFTRGGDEETVTLTETGRATGMFVGTIFTASPRVVVPGDGLLQVSDGETISAEYYDQDDGTGEPAWVQDTAVVDCQPPVFDGLNSATAGAGFVELQWDAASDQQLPITYNIYRDQTPGPPIGSLIGSTWALSYLDYDPEPGQTYYYVVRAQDALGNEDGNTVELNVTIRGLYLPIILKSYGGS